MPKEVDKIETQAELPLNWDEALKKLKSIEDKLMEYVGKEGYNPFIFMKKSGITDIRAKLNKGVKLKELYDKIMALKFEEPKVKV